MSNPTILWAQDRNNLFLTLEILNLESHECRVEDKKIIFQGKSGEEEYNLEIDLHSSVNEEKYSVEVKPSYVKMVLEKSTRQFWNRLTKTKQNNIKIDWQKWVHDEESSEESDEDLMANFNDFKKTLPSELLEKDFTELLPGDDVEDHDIEGEDDCDGEGEGDVADDANLPIESQSIEMEGEAVVNELPNNEGAGVEPSEDLEGENGDNSVESLDSGFLANGEESITEDGEVLELRETDGKMVVDELDVEMLDAELENDLGV